jgi:hypothetical protein
MAEIGWCNRVGGTSDVGDPACMRPQRLAAEPFPNSAAQATEHHMPNRDTFDIATIDLKALPPSEWVALKRRIIRRAHAERTQEIRAMFVWLFCRRWRVSHADTAHQLGCGSAAGRQRA